MLVLRIKDQHKGYKCFNNAEIIRAREELFLEQESKEWETLIDFMNLCINEMLLSIVGFCLGFIKVGTKKNVDRKLEMQI